MTTTIPGDSTPLNPPQRLGALTELAMDLRWSWNHGADELWRRLDPALWELTHHPNVVLQTVAREKLASSLADPGFCELLDRLVQARREAAAKPRWFQQNHPQAPLTCVAYFCMEFMLSEALPIYSGGLGNVAGDQLKAASDLGVPVVGVGLLYQHGYFRQMIDRNGAQQALYPYERSRTTAHRPGAPGERRMACGWRSCCPATPSGFAPGRSRLAGSRSTCSTRMTRPIFPCIAGSRANCMAAGRNCA